MTNLLKKYIRKENREPFGVIVGTKEGVGWSITSKKDKYNPRIGLTIAINRANFNDPKRKLKIPAEIAEMIEHMDQRRKKYFKL